MHKVNFGVKKSEVMINKNVCNEAQEKKKNFVRKVALKWPQANRHKK